MNAQPAQSNACTANTGGRAWLRAAGLGGWPRCDGGSIRGLRVRAGHWRRIARDVLSRCPLALGVDAAWGHSARTQSCSSKHPDGYRDTIY